MTKDKVQDYDSTAANNTDVGGANIAEGCAPSGINNAIRNFMSHIAAALSGADDKIITGTPGSNGNFASFNGDGDLVAATGTANVEAIAGLTSAAGKVPYFTGSGTAGLLTVTGSDANAVTGTAGTNGNLVQWNADGDVVDGPDVLDEDDMASDSASAVPTQQSVKAYVDEDIAKTIAVGYVAGGNFSVAFDAGCTVTRAATGVYTVTFDTVQANTNYSVSALPASSNRQVNWSGKTTSAFNIEIRTDSTGALTDTAFDFIVQRAR